ncbi:Nucleoside-diphosphate sugar epimerase/dehydratase [Roseibacterium elongatum DSM 19469]|uniref:Nucleoside-diphosphate sugar epimerase/dehydratase n=1 Tax=Roseicyclus elongatus DSM 19469 TaxID=1294273 RepID=W8RRF1_9RHOB|nr:nucleoside-diphosphate sugar epimerase/dehydratase [Roseibacterium elongatum]AHM03759.1 Nucleoside-diphosphate sugar epimerase/dehydratase [Roseibacterium elongatum DSM 19469]
MERFLDFIFALSRRQKRLVQAFIDVAIICVAFALAMLLRLDGLRFASNTASWSVLLPVIPLTIAAFWALGLYQAVVRYIASSMIRTIGIGAIASAIVMFAAALQMDLPVPRSVPGIYAIVLFLLVGGARMVVRLLSIARRANKSRNVIIYGAGSSGRQLMHGLRQGIEFNPVAFVDDDASLHKSQIGGCKVYAPHMLQHLLDRYQAGVVLLAMPKLGRAERNRIVSRLEPLSVQVMTVPGLADLVSGKHAINELRSVAPEDLLGRDPVPPRADLMHRKIESRTVLVTGAGGSIGSELCRKILTSRPETLILLDISEFALYTIHEELQIAKLEGDYTTNIVPLMGSVQNADRMAKIMIRYNVNTVFHAAAYKHVPLVEQNVIEGIRNNVFGTFSLIKAARDHGVRDFTLVSTDKAVRPTNAMGASKRLAELICQALALDEVGMTISMVRFGNVLGSSGSVIPRFHDQIRKGGPVTVTHPEMTRYFMTIPEAAELVIQAGAMARGGEVFVLDMGQPVRILDLAEQMVRLHGLKPYRRTDAGNEQDGDIEIVIAGLRPAEKLYEELLIGDNPQPTSHPRIMCASEDCLSFENLTVLLEQLDKACSKHDIPRILRLISDAPTGYIPSSTIHDLLWSDKAWIAKSDPVAPLKQLVGP